MRSPWLHRCAVLLAVISLASVFTGAAVTGNPERPYYSVGQTHLWLSIAAGALTITVVLWLASSRGSTALRRLGWSAIAAVAFEAVVGLQPLPQPPALRITHAAIAELLFSAIVVIAVCTGRRWAEPPKRAEGSSFLRFLGNAAPIVVLAQVALGTLFRHGVLGVGPHLIGAFVIAFFILGVTLSVIYKPEHSELHLTARALLTIASVQVFVGLTLFSMQSMDVDPSLVILVTMIHAATGALTLAATVVMAILIQRHVYLPDSAA
jgi:heme A synthase